MSAHSFDRAVRRETRRLRRRRPVTQYGYDARRRARARQDAADAARRRRRHYEALIILIATAVFIIGWDHERGPVRIDPTGVTSTATPHPATTGGHP
jgi:hypothetical protein